MRLWPWGLPRLATRTVMLMIAGPVTSPHLANHMTIMSRPGVLLFDLDHTGLIPFLTRPFYIRGDGGMIY